MILRRGFHRRLSLLADVFDSRFYLAQMPSGRSRALAERDPLLHFWLIGSRQGRSPHPSFDAGAHRRIHPWIRPGADAYVEHVKLSITRGAAPAPLPASRSSSTKVAMVLDHGRGGGSTRLLSLYADRLSAEGWTILTARRVGQETPLFVIPVERNGRGDGGLRAFDLFADEAALVATARSLGVRRLVINHLIDLPAEAGEMLARFASQIGADYEILLHDYFYVCPRIDLIASDGRYCGLAPVERCRDCLSKSGPVLRDLDPLVWRARAASLLSGASLVLAPSQDLAARLGGAFPSARIEAWEPEDDSSLPARPAPPPLAANEPLRLLLLGGLNHPKGQSVIIGLARVLARRGAPIKITLLGPAADPAAVRRAGVRVHGRYKAEDLDTLLAMERPHVIFFAAIWPETWSFALTEALRTPAEILAFDIGAIAERLRRLGRGRLLAYEIHADPDALADAIIGLRQSLSRDLKAPATMPLQAKVRRRHNSPRQIGVVAFGRPPRLVTHFPRRAPPFGLPRRPHMSENAERPAGATPDAGLERLALRKPAPMRLVSLFPPFDRYMGPAPEAVLSTPSMMSENELTFLYNIVQRYYTGAGRIVDAGTFLGGSTHCFTAGIRNNARYAQIAEKWPKPILSLERAIVSPTMPAFFARHGIGANYKPGDSFADLLEEIVSPCKDLVELRIGDIMEKGDMNNRIEILFLDVLKNPQIANYALKQYFPKLIPGRSIVIQQDYFFEGLPFIKTYQEFFAEQFEYIGEVGSSAIFRCRAKVEKAAIDEVLSGLPPEQQLHLSSIALQRSRDPLRRLMMAMSKTLLVKELRGVEAARAYLDFVEGEFSGEIGDSLPPRLAKPLQALRRQCDMGSAE